LLLRAGWERLRARIREGRTSSFYFPPLPCSCNPFSTPDASPSQTNDRPPNCPGFTGVYARLGQSIHPKAVLRFAQPSYFWPAFPRATRAPECPIVAPYQSPAVDFPSLPAGALSERVTGMRGLGPRSTVSPGAVRESGRPIAQPPIGAAAVSAPSGNRPLRTCS
jgi:hypothetical protein